MGGKKGGCGENIKTLKTCASNLKLEPVADI